MIDATTLLRWMMEADELGVELEVYAIDWSEDRPILRITSVKGEIANTPMEEFIRARAAFWSKREIAS